MKFRTLLNVSVFMLSLSLCSFKPDTRPSNHDPGDCITSVDLIAPIAFDYMLNSSPEVKLATLPESYQSEDREAIPGEIVKERYSNSKRLQASTYGHYGRDKI